MPTTVTDHAPRVWIGCLHCYNSGHLIGEWFDAVDADQVTLADVHRGSGRGYAACEELLGRGLEVVTLVVVVSELDLEVDERERGRV